LSRTDLENFKINKKATNYPAVKETPNFITIIKKHHLFLF